MTDQPHNPLHGLTLEAILTKLVERHGWEALGERILHGLARLNEVQRDAVREGLSPPDVDCFENVF